MYGHVKFDKETEIYNGKKKKPTSANDADLSECLHVKECKQINLSPCIKLKFMWIKGFNTKPHALNMIEEKVGISLECFVTGENFLNETPIAHAL